jgi:hypothetical protein
MRGLRKRAWPDLYLAQRGWPVTSFQTIDDSKQHKLDGCQRGGNVSVLWQLRFARLQTPFSSECEEAYGSQPLCNRQPYYEEVHDEG